jgi:hypothetical protein
MPTSSVFQRVFIIFRILTELFVGLVRYCQVDRGVNRLREQDCSGDGTSRLLTWDAIEALRIQRDQTSGELRVPG